MLIDLNELRPQNETQEHFFLKQVGRAYLFKQGIRCIATEVEGLRTLDNPTFGTPKMVIDVLGIDKRNKRHEPSIKLQEKIHHLALEIGKKRDLTEETNWGTRFLYFYSMKDKNEKTRTEIEIEMCFEEACTTLGYQKDLYKKLRFYYQHVHEMRGIEVKVSYSDFKNGFNMLPEYSYVLAPVGIVPKEELPEKVGLLEFDFDLYQKAIEEGKEDSWFQALKTTKRPKKGYDSQFLDNKGKKTFFNRGKHAVFCEDLLFTIAQQNTEEHIFWNPHLRHIHHTLLNHSWTNSFSLNVGQKTPFGYVVDRRIGVYSYTKDELTKRYPGGIVRNKKEYRMPYYKFAGENGLSKWMPFHQVEEKIKEDKNDFSEKLLATDTINELIPLYMSSAEKGFEWFSVQSKQSVAIEDMLTISNEVSVFVKQIRIRFPFL